MRGIDVFTGCDGPSKIVTLIADRRRRTRLLTARILRRLGCGCLDERLVRPKGLALSALKSRALAEREDVKGHDAGRRRRRPRIEELERGAEVGRQKVGFLEDELAQEGQESMVRGRRPLVKEERERACGPHRQSGHSGNEAEKAKQLRRGRPDEMQPQFTQSRHGGKIG